MPERGDSFSIRVSPIKWSEWRNLAEASGTSMNRWVVQGLTEWAKYEELNLREKQEEA